MKKILILSAVFLLLGAGCTETKQEINITQTKDANQVTNTTNMSKKTNLENQKNLAVEYSQALIKTSKGNIKVSFYASESPVTVNNFMNLAQQGFYNGTSFHRVIKDFMIQGGDPKSLDQTNRALHGTGDPGYKFEDEFNSHKLVRGSLAMANSGSNTNGSQFFIVTAEATPWLDGKHTNFGQVVEGMTVVETIENSSADQRDNPYEPIIVKSIELIK
mgnify:CR=1 FL=1